MPRIYFVPANYMLNDQASYQTNGKNINIRDTKYDAIRVYTFPLIKQL